MRRSRIFIPKVAISKPLTVGNNNYYNRYLLEKMEIAIIWHEGAMIVGASRELEGFHCHRGPRLCHSITPSQYPKLIFSINIPFQAQNTPLQNCVSHHPWLSSRILIFAILILCPIPSQAQPLNTPLQFPFPLAFPLYKLFPHLPGLSTRSLILILLIILILCPIEWHLVLDTGL